MPNGSRDCGCREIQPKIGSIIDILLSIEAKCIAGQRSVYPSRGSLRSCASHMTRLHFSPLQYCGGAPRRLLNSVDFGGFQLVLHVTGIEV